MNKEKGPTPEAEGKEPEHKEPGKAIHPGQLELVLESFKQGVRDYCLRYERQQGVSPGIAADGLKVVAAEMQAVAKTLRDSYVQQANQETAMAELAKARGKEPPERR